MDIKSRLNKIYAEKTGQPIEKIEKAMDRDNFMNAEAAQEFGLIDQVVTHRPLSSEARKSA